MIEILNQFIKETNKVKLFVGIGNILKSDDGIGVYISNHIKESKSVKKLTVEVSIENYLGKINSLNTDVLILVDCVDFGKQPGYAEMLPAEKVKDFTLHTHNISLKRVAELFKMPVFILGIQPKSIDFGEEISEIVLETADNILAIINQQTLSAMPKNYLCPICKGHLRVKNSILLSAKSKKNEKGLIFLNSEIGNYTITTHRDFKIHKGEEYTFYCPICHATLNREKNPNLVKIILVEEEGGESEIYFSSLAGEKCTYIIKDKEIEELGPDAEKHKKYFHVPEEYKKYL